MHTANKTTSQNVGLVAAFSRICNSAMIAVNSAIHSARAQIDIPRHSDKWRLSWLYSYTYTQHGEDSILTPFLLGGCLLSHTTCDSCWISFFNWIHPTLLKFTSLRVAKMPVFTIVNFKQMLSMQYIISRLQQ